MIDFVFLVIVLALIVLAGLSSIFVSPIAGILLLTTCAIVALLRDRL